MAKKDPSLPDPTHVSLKGANVNKIEKIFGLKIHDAISQCPVRREEIANGRNHTTDCISMSVENETAWIHLTLGLSQATADIIPKLDFLTTDVDDQ